MPKQTKSNNKRSARKSSSFSSRKSKKYSCIKCRQKFISTTHFCKHVIENPSCRSSNFCCKFCPYIGYNEHSLNSHLRYNSSCQQKYNEAKVATGVLPYTLKSIPKHKNLKNILVSTSLLQQPTNSDDNNHQTYISVCDNVSNVRESILHKTTSLNQYMNNNRIVAGTNNNQVSSTLLLDDTYSNDIEKANNNFFFKYAYLVINQDLSRYST